MPVRYMGAEAHAKISRIRVLKFDHMRIGTTPCENRR